MGHLDQGHSLRMRRQAYFYCGSCVWTLSPQTQEKADALRKERHSLGDRGLAEGGISVARGGPALLNSLDAQGPLSCTLPAFLCLCPPSLIPQEATLSHGR